MLPEQTKRVENLLEEREFFIEQMFREVKRMVADNVQMQIVGLKDMLEFAAWSYIIYYIQISLF